MNPCATPYQHSAVPPSDAQQKAELRVNHCPKSQGQSTDGRRVSHCNQTSRLTQAEATTSKCQPDTAAAQTTVVVQHGRPASATFEHMALKTALQNLTHRCLSPGDFVVLVNRFGYHAPLDHFALTLQPYDWLALKEHNREQILQSNPSFLRQLPPEVVTCDICMSIYMRLEGTMISWVPERLKESFFTQLVEHDPRAILDIPVQERTVELLRQACCAHCDLLDQISERERSAELVSVVFQHTGHGLQYIPPAERSYELCLKACQANGMALRHVPEALKDDEICRVALTLCGQAYRWLPERLAKRRTWQLLACQRDGAALQWIAKDRHSNILLTAACRNNGLALMFIDEQRITPLMSRLAFASHPSQSRSYIPEHHMDETMRLAICYTTDDRLLCERLGLNTAEFYEQVLQKNPASSLNWIPVTARTPTHYLLACTKNGADLELVPVQYRSFEACRVACWQYGAALQWVPEHYRTALLCQIACYNHQAALQWVPAQRRTKYTWLRACEKSMQACQHIAKGQVGVAWFVDTIRRTQSPYLLLTHAKRLLSAADFQLLLESSVLCAGSHKMAMLTHPQISHSQKKELLEWILEPSSWPTPEMPQLYDLYEMASPLRVCLDNPELKRLELRAARMAKHWAPPRYNSGRQLLAEIEQALCSTAVGLADHNEPLLADPGTLAGGRTLKIEQGAQTLYYKFQRQHESLKTLMQEGIIHTVREKQPELFGQLRSKLPGGARFFRLYLDLLPEGRAPAFADPLEILRDESNRRYVHVYHYVARADYSVYAHHTDLGEPDNPYQKGEQGILAACHDIGRFVALGLVPTSTLPAFHNTADRRQWMALHALLGYHIYTLHPGTFGAWNTTATEYCDFGYSGFRDVGDFEPFGQIESFMNRADARQGLQEPEMEQCLCLLNAVCENLLAAHLIRARLRQQGADYHYKNPEALQQTEAFIEQSLLSFLQGMYNQSERDFLRERLELDTPAYKRWLARAAVETVYWTAKQPLAGQPDLPPFDDNSTVYSHQDGYALHLNRTGHLDPELYPDLYARLKGGGRPVYPTHFHNVDGQLNLGCHIGVFPLTTLMRGLTRLCTGILACDHNAVALSSEPMHK